MRRRDVGEHEHRPIASQARHGRQVRLDALADISCDPRRRGLIDDLGEPCPAEQEDLAGIDAARVEEPVSRDVREAVARAERDRLVASVAQDPERLAVSERALAIAERDVGEIAARSVGLELVDRGHREERGQREPGPAVVRPASLGDVEAEDAQLVEERAVVHAVDPLEDVGARVAVEQDHVDIGCGRRGTSDRHAQGEPRQHQTRHRDLDERQAEQRRREGSGEPVDQGDIRRLAPSTKEPIDQQGPDREDYERGECPWDPLAGWPDDEEGCDEGRQQGGTWRAQEAREPGRHQRQGDGNQRDRSERRGDRDVLGDVRVEDERPGQDRWIPGADQRPYPCPGSRSGPGPAIPPAAARGAVRPAGRADGGQRFASCSRIHPVPICQ